MSDANVTMPFEVLALSSAGLTANVAVGPSSRGFPYPTCFAAPPNGRVGPPALRLLFAHHFGDHPPAD
jgi:hypothetical protein